MTYEHPWYGEQLRLANTTNLDAQLPQKPQKASLGRIRTDLSDNRKGDLAEQWVQIIAAYKGAEIYPNRYCDGKTDLILKIDDLLAPIDVKLASWDQRHSCWRSTRASEVELPVYPVIVIPEGDITDWKIRWKNVTSAHNSPPHCPPGLEDFWKKPPELKNEPTN